MAAKNPFSNPLSTPAKVIDLFHRYGLLDDDRVETIKQHAANNESGAQERVYQQTRLALKNYRRLKAIQKNRRKAIERSDAFGVCGVHIRPIRASMKPLLLQTGSIMLILRPMNCSGPWMML